MSDLKYTTDHECLKIEGDIAWVGITKYAKDALGDLVYIELPEIGQRFEKGGNFAVIESVKTAAEVYTPIAGEVVEVNNAMSDNFDLLERGVDDGGWIAKIKVQDPAQMEELMDETAYNEFLATQD